MEKVNHYRQILQEVLTEYSTDRSGYPQPVDVETQLLFDSQNDHYQVLRVGWRNRKQVFLVIFHFDIKNEKIWLQQNVTDYDIIGDLEARGIPKSDIVLAFHFTSNAPFYGLCGGLNKNTPSVFQQKKPLCNQQNGFFMLQQQSILKSSCHTT